MHEASSGGLDRSDGGRLLGFDEQALDLLELTVELPSRAAFQRLSDLDHGFWVDAGGFALFAEVVVWLDQRLEPAAVDDSLVAVVAGDH